MWRRNAHPNGSKTIRGFAALPPVVVWTVFNHGVIPLTRDRTLPFVQVNVELRRQCDEKTVMKLLEEFALAKHTGLEKPGLLT